MNAHEGKTAGTTVAKQTRMKSTALKFVVLVSFTLCLNWLRIATGDEHNFYHANNQETAGQRRKRARLGVALSFRSLQFFNSNHFR